MSDACKPAKSTVGLDPYETLFKTFHEVFGDGFRSAIVVVTTENQGFMIQQVVQILNHVSLIDSVAESEKSHAGANQPADADADADADAKSSSDFDDLMRLKINKLLIN